MKLRIIVIHFLFWIIIFFFDLFTLYAVNSLSKEDVKFLIVSVTISTTITFLYAFYLYKLHFFKKIAYQHQFLAFITIATTITFLVANVYIFLEQFVMGKEKYPSWNDYFIDFFVISFNAGRFILMCLLGHHTYYLGKQVIEDKEKENVLKLKFLTLQQETLKLRLKPDFLDKIFTFLEKISTKDTKTARKIISILSDILRNILSYDKNECIDMMQEIDIMEKYLLIISFIQEPKIEIYYNDDFWQAGRNSKMPTNTLFTIVNFLLDKTDNQLILDLKIIPQTTQKILSFHFKIKKNSNDFVQELNNDVSITNLKERLKNQCGNASYLEYDEEKSSLSIVFKGSSIP